MANNEKKNLIINYLPNSLSQEDVKTIFDRIGEVATCKLVRNKLTGASLGYAFVEYVKEVDAATAISQITGLEMQGKKLKVSYARPQADAPKNANLYVANLPASVTDEILFDMFAVHGSIVSHKILTNADGSSRGAGFVRFSSGAEASSAIDALNGTTVPPSTTPLTVKLALPPAAKTNQSSLNAITNTALSGIGVVSRNANVRFNPMIGGGATQSTNTVLGASSVAAALSGMPAHLAQHGTAAQLAQQQLAQQQLAQQLNGGQVVAIGQAAATVAPIGGCVYIYGLQGAATELTLYELFSPFGAIMSVKLIRDTTKEEKPCKGYGFVNFTRMEDALLAIASMNGVTYEEKVLQVSLKQNKTQTIGQQQLPTQSSNIQLY